MTVTKIRTDVSAVKQLLASDPWRRKGPCRRLSISGGRARRACPEIQTLSRCGWLWPRYPLSTWMRRAATPVSFSMSATTGPSVCPEQRAVTYKTYV